MTDERFESLRGRRFLIVEDEFMIATDLSDMLEDMGVEVLGPVGSVEDALDLIESLDGKIDAAILDINIRGDRVYPVAENLRMRDVPFIFLSGYDQLVVPSRFSDVPRCDKPVDISQLASALVKRVLH